MGITNAIEMLYKSFEAKVKNKKLAKFTELINKIPIFHIMLVFSLGLNVQLRMLYPSLVNKFIFKVVDMATNGRGYEAASNLTDVLLGFKK